MHGALSGPVSDADNSICRENASHRNVPASKRCPSVKFSGVFLIYVFKNKLWINLKTK
jgi:hypothetical protein